MAGSRSPTAIRVLIVEDELLVAWAARDELERAGLVVCGMAATERQAVRLAQAERPDVALVDVRLKQGSGLGAAQPMAEAGVAVTASGSTASRSTVAPTLASHFWPVAVTVLAVRW